MLGDRQQYEWLVCCSGRPAKGTCVSLGCESHPFMCSEDECPCQHLHDTHVQQKSKLLVEKLAQAPRLSQQLKKDQKIMLQLFLQLQNELKRCQQRHNQLIADYTNRQLKYTALRNQLVRGITPEAKELTGDSIARMIDEIDNGRKLTNLYCVSGERLMDQTVQIRKQMDSVIDEIEKIWKMSSGLSIAHKMISSIFTDHVVFSQKGKTVTAAHFQMSPSTSQVVVSQCTSTEWDLIGDKISQLRGLTSIKIDQCDVSDVFVTSILRCNQLTQLALTKTKITDKGVQLLARQLKNLTALRLGNNKIGISSVHAIAKDLGKLQELSLGELVVMVDNNKEIQDVAVELIAHGLPELRKLDLGNCSVTNKGAIMIADELKNLAHLRLFRNSRVDREGVIHLAKKLKNLVTLGIAGLQVRPEGANIIAKEQTHLLELYVGQCKIGEQGAKDIAETLKSLEKLGIYSNGIGNKGTLAIANGLTSLTLLWINNNGISEETAVLLVTKLKALKELDLSQNTIGSKFKEEIRKIIPHVKLMI